MKYPERILVVEDEIIIAMHTRDELLKKGVLEVEIALNAEEAMELVDSFKPNLLTIDIDMGDGMNGIEFAKHINENYQLPFIYVSSNINDNFIGEVAETNPYGFITKPIDFGNLASTVYLAMKKWEVEKELHEERQKSVELKLLSESNPNLIMRLGVDGFIHYVNPLIQRISGKNAEEYIGKALTDTDLDENLQTIYNTLIEKVKKRKIRSYVEETINTLFGERFFEIHAIPEKDHTGNVTSVVIIKNDITDQKIVLTEVQSKNRYISDSINYGKKIQSAIIPDENILEKYFNDFFLINNPKDVVSGDFPWFYKKDDFVYLAAVDCTGHGVPGAFMSLVTYFLLNNIMTQGEAIDPATVLDRLHLKMKRTLKQHYKGSLTRDGADIALCRMNIETGVVEYSGANRPLVHIGNEEVNIVRGDKMSVGGWRSPKRPKRFANQIVKSRKGDIISFFSDGMTDQFGLHEGEELKFGSQRLNDELIAVKEKPLSEISQHISSTIGKWQGVKKQTDDMLMIGVRM